MRIAVKNAQNQIPNFLFLSSFTWLLIFVPNILYGIVVTGGKQNLIKENNPSKHRVQIGLNSLRYPYLDIDFKNFFIDKKWIKILRNLRNRCMILKPDKWNDILIKQIAYNNGDCFQSFDFSFNDKTKTHVLKYNVTLQNLTTIQKLPKTANIEKHKTYQKLINVTCFIFW